MSEQRTGRWLPKRKRASLDQLPPIRLTERDLAILSHVCAYRALTVSLIDLLLNGRCSAAVSTRLYHRLKLLYHWRYLDRFPLDKPTLGGATFVYVPDERGAEVVSTGLALPVAEIWEERQNRIVRGQVDHWLETNQVRAALEVSARENDVSLLRWRDDLSFRRDPIQVRVTEADQLSHLMPDGFCLARSPLGPMGLALELDRGTETVRAGDGASDRVTKCRKYLYWYHWGDYRERVGLRGLRVLVVTRSARRLANLKQAVEELGDQSLFFFALFEDAADPGRVLTSPVWQLAGSQNHFRLID